MLNKISEIYFKYNHLIIYAVFGILTVFVNTLMYLLLYKLGFSDLISNTIAFLIAVQFAYFTNTRYVFKAAFTKKNFMQFWTMRISTIFIDNLGLLFFLYIGMERGIAKILVNMVIIVINYIFSRFYIYK